MSDEDTKKKIEHEKIIELQAKLDKELLALLAHPLVPEEFKNILEE